MSRRAVKEADDIALAAARVFANTCSRLITDNVRTIALGIGAVGAKKADEFLNSLDLSALANGYRGLIDDMDRIADRIFERAS